MGRISSSSSNNSHSNSSTSFTDYHGSQRAPLLYFQHQRQRPIPTPRQLQRPVLMPQLHKTLPFLPPLDRLQRLDVALLWRKLEYRILKNLAPKISLQNEI